MITVQKTIDSTAILSKDGCYRYRLTRVWGNDKKKAAVIMLNPSKANELKTDLSVMNIMNYLIDNEYDRLDIVNLFAYMATDPKELINRNESIEQYNDKHIMNAVHEADIVIIGWVRNDTSYIKSRKKRVEELLAPYRNKLKCFADTMGKTPSHPRNFSPKWKLVDYEFMYHSSK